MHRVRASLWAVACTAVITAGMALLPAVMEMGAATETPVNVRLTDVILVDIRQVIAAAGMVRYEEEYAAVCPQAGMVAQVYVQPGDVVTAGQALLRMDGGAEEAAIASACAMELPVSALPAGVSAEQLTDAAIAEAQTRLDMLTLRAAVDGRVADVYVSKHSGVTPGMPAVLLSGERQQIVCQMVARDAQKLQHGMQATVLLSGETAGEACVERIGAMRTDAVTGQSVCDVTLSLAENLPAPLGAPVEVEIILLCCENVTTVPLTALDKDGCLWVAEQGRCWRVEEAVLLQDDMRCWVSLPVGTQVIDRPGEMIEGQLYREETP